MQEQAEGHMTSREALEMEVMRTEREKLMTEIALNGKRVRYFEMSIGIAIFAIGIAFAKLFLP